MKHGYREDHKHCRWCSKLYYASKPVGRDGFCRKACKQAHYRAFKKYVTAEESILRALRQS